MPAKRSSQEPHFVDDEIVEHLRKTLLGSDTFRNNFRSKEILTFLFSQCKNRVVTSERDVAQACYADPTASGKVRVAMHQLRSQLGKYFEGEGRTSDFVIEIPKGRYALRFVSRASAERTSSSE